MTHATDTTLLPAPAAGRRYAQATPEALHDAWVDACLDLSLAYASWSDAEPEDRADCHAVFVAALDRESAAADALADALG